MSPDNDHLAKLMSDIDPVTTPLNRELTVKELGLLKRIKASSVVDSHPVSGHVMGRNWWKAGLASTVIAACVILAFVFIPILTQATKANALTPSPLKFSVAPLSTTEVMDRARTLLAESNSQASAQRSTEYIGWYLQVEFLTDTETRVAVSPQVISINWAEDGSGRVVATAGEPYWAGDVSGMVPSSQAPVPGTVLTETTYLPGEFNVGLPADPGSSESDLFATLLSLGMPADADTAMVIDYIQFMLTLWTLTNSQHERLLSMLLNRDDIIVNGTATDREGRPVIGVSASARGIENTLLISATTGRIIGMETISTISQYGLPAGVVTAYTLWKDTPE